MFSRRFQLSFVLVLALCLFALPQIGTAQTNSAVCQTTIAQAVSSTGVNCANRAIGTACYGSPEIESNLTVESTNFDEPGERVNLSDVIHLRPQAPDLTEQTWGITVLNLQANLPSGFARDIVAIGLGGLEIESGVLPENSFSPLSAPVTLTTSAAGELREATMDPLDGDALGQVPSGASIAADAVSPDGNWVRVIYQNQAGWLASSAFGAGGANNLPTLDGFSPMQSFFLRTGIDGQPCATAPSLLTIQGPRDSLVEIEANGVDIRIESTIVLRTLPPGEPAGRQMEIVVLSGVATIFPENGAPILVPAGYALIVNLGPELVSLGIEGDADERGVDDEGGAQAFGQPRLLTQAELDELDVLTDIPDNILNYPISVPQIPVVSATTPITPRLIFSNPADTAAISEYCASGELSEAICNTFGF